MNKQEQKHAATTATRRCVRTYARAYVCMCAFVKRKKKTDQTSKVLKKYTNVCTCAGSVFGQCHAYHEWATTEIVECTTQNSFNSALGNFSTKKKCKSIDHPTQRPTHRPITSFESAATKRPIQRPIIAPKSAVTERPTDRTFDRATSQ